MALATASFLGLGVSAPALALTLGRIEVLSRLGEPLQAEIDLPDITDDEATTFRATLAAPDDFRAAGLTYQPGLNNLQATLGVRDERVVLQLRGSTPLNSPYVDLVLQAQWAAGRVVRNYTVLLTPPAPAAASSDAAASTAAPALPDTGPSATPAPLPPASVPADTGTSVAKSPVASAGAVKNAASPAARVMVKSGDTAGRIAGSRLPPSVSLDQMLIALLRANPDAFVNGNVNRLKAGAVLEIPSAEQIQATDAQQARRMVRAQSRDFREYRRKLAGLPPPAPPKAAERHAGGRVEANVEDKKAPPATADKLTLSKGAAKGKSQEDQISREANLKETKRQSDAVRKHLEQLEKLSAAVAQAASEPASSAPVATASAPVAAASAPASAPLAVPAPGMAAASSAASAAASPTSSASAPMAPAAPASAASSAAAPSSSLIDALINTPSLPWAGAGLLGLLAVFGVYRARRRAAADSSPFQQALQASLTPEEAPPADALAPTAAPDAEEPADPLDEAVAFLAHGREQQAEDILRAGLVLEPERLALHAKLLEIYAKRQDAASFEDTARRLRELTGGGGEYWDQACELGIAIDPDNPLYHRGGRAEAAPLDTGAAFAAPADEPTPAPEPAALAEAIPEEDLGLSEAAPTSPMTLEVDVPGATQAAAEPDAPELTPADLDLDFGALAREQQASAPPPAPVPPPPPEPTGFDLNAIDLDLGTPQEEAAAIPDNPLSIKIALAEEFSAIGDTDGARSLLEEVIAEASGDLRTQAEEALKKLG